MKIKVLFKTPDVVYNLKSDFEDEETWERVALQLKQWIKFGEYVTIEFDLNDDSARVLMVDDT